MHHHIFDARDAAQKPGLASEQTTGKAPRGPVSSLMGLHPTSQSACCQMNRRLRADVALSSRTYLASHSIAT